MSGGRKGRCLEMCTLGLTSWWREELKRERKRRRRRKRRTGKRRTGKRKKITTTSITRQEKDDKIKTRIKNNDYGDDIT